MRKFYILVSSFIMSVSLYAQTNFDFESWTGIVPDGWESYNDFASYGVPQTVFQETANPGEGLSSARLETVYWSGGVMFGLDTLKAYVRQSFAYTQKPNRLDLRVIANPQAGDQNAIIVLSTKWNASTNSQDNVGVGVLLFDAPTSGWIDTSVTISYTMPDTPDSMTVIATSSAAGIFGNGQGVGAAKIGSQLYIDSLVLNLTAPCSVQLFPYSQNDLCSSGNGVVGVYAIGMSPYTYTWSNGGTTDVMTGLSGGTYSVTVEDANGCFGYETISITSTPPMTVTASSTPVSVCGASDGTATVNVTGGVTPYAYNWASLNGTSYGTTQTITGLPQGGYLVTVVDAAGCMDGDGVAVNANGGPQVGVSVTDVSCNGASNGVAVAYVTGGTGPYTYSWEALANPSYSASTSSISGLVPDVYVVTVTDANGCVGVGGETVNEPDPLMINVSSTSVTSTGGNDGTATASVSGGTTPYSYSWNNGATISVITGLSAGTYTVTVMDANGCTQSASVSVSEPSVDCSTFFVTVTSTDVTTCGGSDGSVTAIPSGGTSPYNYIWTNLTGNTVGTTATVTGLAQGGYMVTVTDANGCSASNGVAVNSANGPQVTVTSTSVTCAGGSDGTATAIVTGGTTPYTYNWTALNNTSFSATGQTITGLSSDIYVVTVTDANGCSGGNGTFVDQPSAISLTATVTDVSVAGGSDGSISVFAQGGVSPYSYSWNNGATTATITGLSAGNYMLQLTDVNGCLATWQGVVNEPGTTISCNGFGVTLTATDVTTQGGSDGAISSTVAGGTTPYTYNWSNGQATPSLSGLFAGTYSLTVTDAYGCVATATAVVNDGQAPSYVQDNTLQRTKVFPVPAREQLVIQTGLNKPVEYQIINPLGQTVVKGYVVSQKNVDVSQLARGSYILSLNNNTDYHKIKITLIK